MENLIMQLYQLGLTEETILYIINKKYPPATIAEEEEIKKTIKKILK